MSTLLVSGDVIGRQTRPRGHQQGSRSSPGSFLLRVFKCIRSCIRAASRLWTVLPPMAKPEDTTAVRESQRPWGPVDNLSTLCSPAGATGGCDANPANSHLNGVQTASSSLPENPQAADSLSTIPARTISEIRQIGSPVSEPTHSGEPTPSGVGVLSITPASRPVPNPLSASGHSPS